jgi:tetratricopeptide (TPR) repeat protein
MCAFLIMSLSILVGQPDDSGSFSLEKANFKLTYPPGWRRIKPPNENIQLAIQRRYRLIMVTAGESRATLEEVLENYQEGLKLHGDAVKELSRKNAKVAGEKALTVTLEMRESGLKMNVVNTVFVHQGIAYQVLGIRQPGADQEYDAAYASVLENFEFLTERKEWLAKLEGQPARTALLGGLVSFELNRPRWTETTFEGQPSYTFLDQASYQFFPGGAWITVRTRQAKGGAAVELDELRHDLSALVQNPKVTPTMVTNGGRQLAALEITGTAGDISQVLRGTVAVEDGLTVQLWIQSHGSYRETTRRDWDQLLKSFILQRQSKPDSPPAFPVQADFGEPAADPALAVFLSQATRLLPEGRPDTVLALSPDGGRALLRTRDGTVLENLTTHKREPLALAGFTNAAVAWSPDAKRLAYAAGEEIIVLDLDSKKTQKVKARAIAIAFGPQEGELLVCTNPAGAGNPIGVGFNRFGPATYNVSRLDCLPLGKGRPETLVDFPLGRVAYPTVSPDGRRLALVTNRDYPRTAPVGGHLYVGAADGSGLRQLTQEPEDFSAVAWSPDGKALYAVRRLAVGDDGAVGLGGEPDLYRISPETGRAENLTRSGRVGRVWAAGRDLILEIMAWDIPPAQRGLFRINGDQLTRATAAQAIPPPANPRAQRKQLAARVQAALGTTNLKQVVPTPALMEKAAHALTEGAASIYGRPLDFRAASLDRLSRLVDEIDLGEAYDPAILLGLGAYYGETLRQAAGAEWQIQPLPLGDWVPGREAASTPLAEVVLPLSAVFFASRSSEGERLRIARDLHNRQQGQKLVLVYPPTHGAAALRAATDAAYYQARKLLDQGEVKPAIDLLAKELRLRPRNRPLALEVIALCEAARLPELANELTRSAVDGGSEVPELLLRYADEVARQDPQKALAYYRKAVQGPWPAAEAFLKLGQNLQALGQTPVAESCWRRAYWRATPEQREAIRKLMGLPALGQNEAAAPDDD